MMLRIKLHVQLEDLKEHIAGGMIIQVHEEQMNRRRKLNYEMNAFPLEPIRKF